MEKEHGVDESVVCGVQNKSAADYLHVRSGNGAGAAVPQLINRNIRTDKVAIMFRPRDKYRDVTVKAEQNGTVIFTKKLVAVTPGEMIRLDIPASEIGAADGADIVVSLEGGAN